MYDLYNIVMVSTNVNWTLHASLHYWQLLMRHQKSLITKAKHPCQHGIAFLIPKS